VARITPRRIANTTTILAALLATTLPGGCEKEPQAAAKPAIKKHNVLLVTLDTTRADRMSCYGHSAKTSPNMDALAADGVRFDMAIAQAALTPVSHASIFTGLLPPQHGLRVLYAKSGYRLSEAIPTLATALRDQGWKTGAFLSSFPVSEFFGFDNGFETFDNGLRHPSDDVLKESPDGAWRFAITDNQRRSDLTTSLAINWLSDITSPFYLWVHYWDPHDLNIRPPEEVMSKFAPPGSPPSDDKRRALYDSEIFYVDLQFGRLVQTLKDRSIYDDTIIVVVSDHGEGLGNHDHWFHRILYQEQIRVPLIMRLPGGPTGRAVSELVRTTDIYPTVLAALNIPLPSRVDGLSMLGLIDGQPEEPRIAYADALILYDLNAKDLLDRRPNDDLLHCVMDRSWKLIYKPNRPEQSELYHLETDPGETKNLYAQQSEQAARLQSELEELNAFVDGPFGEGTDEDVLDRLRSLGYVE